MQPVNPSEILRSFNLPDVEFKVREIKQGLINDTYFVLQEDQILYVLQRINTVIFKDPEALMDNLQKALALLRASDYHPVQLVQTREGKYYKDAQTSGCWRLMTYIPGSITHNTTTSSQTAFEAGRILGRFHRLMQEAEPGDFTNILPGFHSLPKRIGEYRKALESCSPGRQAYAQNAIALVNAFMADSPMLNTGEMPLRICHNDTKLNNILFSETNGKALCLIDLDTMMGGYFPFDFGDAIRTIVNTAQEDECNLRKIKFSRRLFVEIVTGLAVHRKLLTQKEIMNLPKGAVYMPLLHGLRALTDYLNGDIYYQAAYEGQNLDRSVSLLTFAQRAREEMKFMERVIAEKLLQSR